jgi:hypothetical protein
MERCRPSVSVARELAETLADLARRDNRSIAEILAAPEAAQIIDSDETTPAERTAALRDHLRRLRYPVSTEWQSDFEAAREALHLPPAMRLDHASAFESDELRLEMRFRNPDELKELSTRMSHWFDDPTLLARLWPSR